MIERKQWYSIQFALCNTFHQHNHYEHNPDGKPGNSKYKREIQMDT